MATATTSVVRPEVAVVRETASDESKAVFTMADVREAVSTEIAAATTELKTKLEAEFASEREKLEASHAAAIAAVTERAEAAEAKIAEAQAQAELAEKTAARVAQVQLRDVPEGFVTDEKAARWGAQSDEVWADTLEIIQSAFAEKAAEDKTKEIASYQVFAPAKTEKPQNGRALVDAFRKTMEEARA